MAPSDHRPSSPTLDHADPVLAKLVETATFDCDWPTLRHHLYLALLAVLPVFLEKGEPAPYTRAVPVHVSPTVQRMERTEDGHVIITHIDESDPSLRPSTHGGLVLPPFPPLNPNRRHPNVMVINAPDRGPMNGTSRGNPFEDEWDEEVIIGGRKMPGWMEEEEGRKEVERVAAKIEELSFPPFTVQRLAELVICPTKFHSTLGKFLRAVEKTLNVTTAYAPPSYTYVPPPSLPPMEGMPGSPSAASSPMDLDSTVPPGLGTPMFSPIPFLPTGGDDASGEPLMDVDGGGDDGLMSPLMLNESSGVFASQQNHGRSPTPEPEEAEAMENGGGAEASKSRGGQLADGEPGAPGTDSTDSTGADPADEGASGETGGTEPVPSAPANQAGDPGSQPYLGRVDELDSGPLTTNGHHVGDDEREDTATGIGEAGLMTPHGMSDQPVPLSSTTVIGDQAREIAPLPHRRGDESHKEETKVDREEIKSEENKGEATGKGEKEVEVREDEAKAAVEGNGGPQEEKREEQSTSSETDTKVEVKEVEDKE